METSKDEEKIELEKIELEKIKQDLQKKFNDLIMKLLEANESQKNI